MKTAEPITASHLAAARAVDHLRRQLGFVAQEDSGALVGVLPIEGANEALLSQLKRLAAPRLSLLITGARARHLGLEVGNAQTVRIDAQQLPIPVLQALADPLAERPNLSQIATLPVTPSHDLLLMLAKHASLLPALLVVESDVLPDEWVRVKLSGIQAYWNTPQLDIVPLVRAHLPIEGAEQTQIACFRERYGTSVHLALTIGQPGENPLVRVHSSCITGDILGSLRCDCGDQLQLALGQIIAQGGGILLYLHQEGRGIGIANKLRAYKLQELGFDTYEANLMLGFDEDERDFAIAASILKITKATHIRLLSNNPRKIESLKKHGIAVAQRVALIAKGGRHNQNYLAAKGKKAGHLF